MAAVIRIVRSATGESRPEDGQYVMSFDHNAHMGRGQLESTGRVDRALRFATKADAMEFWGRQSTFRAVRPDGKPNRPLTAYTVEIEEVP